MEKIELKPYFESKPWAGEIISKIFNAPKNSGEAWLVSAIKNKESRLINNLTLSEFVDKNNDLLGLKKDEQFPVLIKIIDAKENLSIQVHPDNEYALFKGYKNGKYECWYILDETRQKKIIFGLKSVDKNELEKAILDGNLEKYLNYKEIKPHDYLKVTPGTVHAILGGTFLLEVQDPCDITYRLYDYNRLPKRELRIEDSLNVIYKNHSFVDLEKYKILEKNDAFEIYIKGYNKFFVEIKKDDYKVFLVLN